MSSNCCKQKPMENEYGLTPEQLLKLKCYEMLLPLSNDVILVRERTKSFIKWLKEDLES
jgi:hypothetical protein